jgi:23S rRNA (cytosine1962-C5)-methyltransferase
MSGDFTMIRRDMPSSPVVTIARGKIQPLIYRHPWVYSNSIERIDGAPADGDVVDVRAPDGRFLGRGFFSGRSQLRVRVFAWNQGVEADAAWFRERVAAAARYRREVLGLPSAETTAFRAIHADADALPGVVADMFWDVISLQISTVGVDRRRDLLLDALEAEWKPRAIVENDDEAMRDKEGLGGVEPVQRGTLPDGGKVEILESGVRYEVDLRGGQKTGFFCDQRDNRAVAARFAKGRRVLDAFSYTGGFAISCARAGAASVDAIESSGPAVELAKRNAERNGATVNFIHHDVFKTLGAARREGKKWDLVVLDPPKYARSRNDLDKALQKYAELIALGINVTAAGGVLVACTCSGLVDVDTFDAVLREAARETHRALRIIERRGQAPDHPVSITAPESRYLQAVFSHVS